MNREIFRYIIAGGLAFLIQREIPRQSRGVSLCTRPLYILQSGLYYRRGSRGSGRHLLRRILWLSVQQIPVDNRKCYFLI